MSSDWKIGTKCRKKFRWWFRTKRTQWTVNNRQVMECSYSEVSLFSLLRTLCDSRKQQRWLVRCRVDRAANVQRYPIIARQRWRVEISRPRYKIRFVIGQRASQSKGLDEIWSRKMCLKTFPAAKIWSILHQSYASLRLYGKGSALASHWYS